MTHKTLGRLKDIPLDKTAISQSRLNIENKVRSNLFPWNGQFSPQLISALLDTYAGDSDFVLDPFMGSGTVLVEAARHGLSAFGSDINPAPYTIASTYRLVNVGSQRRREILDHVEGILDQAFPDSFFQKAPAGLPQGEVKDTIVRISCDLDEGSVGSGASNTLELAKVVFDALIVLLDFNKPDLTVDRVFSIWRRLRERVVALPHSRRKVEAANCDARQLPLRDACVDLAVTSPPYINVFNYHQQYRRSLESIGWDLLHVARSEIGSNRKHRGNRFLTVTQYCLDMASAVNELCRVCVPDARMILIVGRESNVRKTPFFNADLMARLVQDCIGLEVICRQERVFTNRFGTRIYEDILHLRNATAAVPTTTPRVVAKNILCEAKRYVPQESLDDLNDAIARVESVEESPLYESEPKLTEQATS